MNKISALLFLSLGVACAACGGSSSSQTSSGEAPDPPEVAIGERLFLETRFAQFFFAQNGSRVNDPLVVGDPVMDVTQTTGDPLPGPFAGQSMNCRACHLVDEHAEDSGGVRTYADFARRSPVPARDDGRITTPRNSPPLVDSTLPRTPFFLHFDGEFATLSDLIEGTYTGRNFGWRADEYATALAHLATVIRFDNGTGTLAADYAKLPYPVVLLGISPAIPPEFRLSEPYRIDVSTASDPQILDAVAKLIGAYVDSLIFSKDKTGAFNGSPYDRFLRKNNLPTQPAEGESDLDYSRRLREAIAGRRKLNPVVLGDGSFELHAQEFIFGSRELQGLRIFLAESDAPAPNGSVGNCIACHAAPTFTDFSFHNTGAAQDEYDTIHGDGAFAALDVPGLEDRNADADIYLPPSPAHPDALGVFFDVPVPDDPRRTDLGMWNVFGNPAVPAPQDDLEALLCTRSGLPPSQCSPDVLLPTSIALFKTPGLRDLGQSEPYLHNGQKTTLEDVIEFYVKTSHQARSGVLRNAAPELSAMSITNNDVAPLAAFLRALNEDYD